MLIRIQARKTLKGWFLLVVFYLLLFQDPLTELISIFSYIDEVFALFGIVVLAHRALTTGRLRLTKSNARIVCLLAVFLLAGLLGNVIYRYQPIEAVMIDLYTNFKFFLSIVSGYVLFSICEPNKEDSLLVGHARMMSVMFFVLLCIDLVFHVFPSAGVRYGLRSAQLFYFHPTYLAGSMVFLLTILLVFYQKKNVPYMLCALAVLVSTLRGKALAGAVAYVMLAYFLVYYRRSIKPIHIVIMAAAAVAVAWEQISYYFVELDGESARSVLVTTSVQILKDYFPIGTGFGTYASASAIKYYSPVYYLYGLNYIWGLSESFSAFGSDSFWPIILGQTGAIGTFSFVSVLLLLFLRLQKIRKLNINAYAAGLFAFAYIMICSTAEPAFHNSVSIPLAMIIGYIFTLERRENTECLKN